MGEREQPLSDHPFCQQEQEPMTESDYIRAAVELAEGWRIDRSNIAPKIEIVVPPFLGENMHGRLDNLHAGIKDALAAELVRMVDALDDPEIVLQSFYDRCYITRAGKEQIATARGPDRTMNSIKAVVDFANENPGVLG